MKLSFTTLGCPEWSFEQILTEAQRMGFPAIEIRGIEGAMEADQIEYFKPGRQQETKRRLADHGLDSTNYCFSCRKNGDCQLQAVCNALGVTEPAYPIPVQEKPHRDSGNFDAYRFTVGFGYAAAHDPRDAQILRYDIAILLGSRKES